MTWLQMFRLFALGFSVFAGIVVLSIGAHLTSLSEKYFAGFDNFEVFGVAVGVITVLTVPVMLIVDYLRTGAFTSMVLVELAWLSILWVLWLAEGALTADETQAVFQTCDFIGSPILTQACNETRAIEGFAFLTWLILLAYTITLLVVALLNNSRGAPMWASSVKQHPSVVPDPNSAPQPALPLVAPQPQPAQYPGQQQPQMQAYDAVPTPAPSSQAYPAHGSPAAMGSVAYASSTTAGHNGYPQV